MKTSRFLYTWQYAADAAYIIMYYQDEDAAKAYFEIWDASSCEHKSKLTTLELDFVGDISTLHLYSVNDVVYLAHQRIRLKRIWREVTEAGNIDFFIGKVDIPIDPVLMEYSDRNKFEVEEGAWKEDDVVTITEKELTEKEIKNGAEKMFTLDYGWWRQTGDMSGEEAGGQMIMLKHSTEMAKTWGLTYDTSTNTSAHIAINPVPEPSETTSSGHGGRCYGYEGTGGECTDMTDGYENEDYENPDSERLKYDWKSEWIYVTGKVSVETAGKWSGKLVIDLWKPDMETTESGTPTEWETLAVIDVHNAMSNKTIERDLDVPGSRVRVRCVRRERSQAVSVNYDNGSIKYNTTDNDTGCYVTISYAQEIPVYLRITAVFDGYAHARVLHPFSGGFTSTSFAEGAWCLEKYGYPRAVGVFQERLVYAGNNKKPCTFWCSKTDDWTNFIQGSDSTSPIFGTANTDNLDAMQWLQITKSYVMFGSLSGEWYFGASDGSSVTPSNYSFRRLSNYGSTNGIDAVLFGNSTIVAKNGGRQIMDVSYNTLSETGDGANLSLYAEHFFENDKIIALESTRSPKLMLWVLTESGRLCSFTYEQNNNVFAWARHEIHDGVIAIASFRRNERDILAMLVKDGDKVMLGELDPNRWIDYNKDSTNPDEKEHIFQDEKADDTFVNYESRIVPTPIRPLQNDQVYGQKMAFSNVDIYLKTHNGDFDGTVWADGTEFWIKLGSNDNANPTYCDAGWLASNEKKIFGENRIKLPVGSGWSDEGLVDIWTDYPAPLTITAIGAEIALPPVTSSKR